MEFSLIGSWIMLLCPGFPMMWINHASIALLFYSLLHYSHWCCCLFELWVTHVVVTRVWFIPSWCIGTVRLWLKTTNIESKYCSESRTLEIRMSADEYTSPSLSVSLLCATVGIESPALDGLKWQIGVVNVPIMLNVKNSGFWEYQRTAQLHWVLHRWVQTLPVKYYSIKSESCAFYSSKSIEVLTFIPLKHLLNRTHWLSCSIFLCKTQLLTYGNVMYTLHLHKSSIVLGCVSQKHHKPKLIVAPLVSMGLQST